jgi:hypothetical protein
MAKIVCVGDLHLDKLTNKANYVIPNVVDKQIRILENIIKKELVPFEDSRLILLGDVAHYTTLSEESKIALLSLFIKYDDINIDIICGNHDYKKDSVDSLRWLEPLVKSNKLPNLKVHYSYSKTVVDGVSLHFVPYPLTSVDDEKAKGFAFGHFTRAGAVLDNGKVHEGGVEQDDNLIWINGHIHKKQILKSKSKGKTIYVGTPYQTAPIEQDEKFYLTIDTSTKKIEWVKPKQYWKFVYTEDESEVNGNTDDSIIYILKGKTNKKNVIQSYGKTFAPSISVLEHLEKWLEDNTNLDKDGIGKVKEIAQSIEGSL